MFAVIMCGGSGTRFWPVSRMQKPKQFLTIGGKDPMVVETSARLKPLSRDEEMILVLGNEHLKGAKELFKNRRVHMLAEPVGRNTAPCIGLGALFAKDLGCEGPVAFLPADHYIGDEATFVEGLRQAGKIAASGGIVTLGIVPTRPETGYGYIRKSESPVDYKGLIPGLSDGTHPELKSNLPAYEVSAFVEKPDLQKAEYYLSSGAYLWNAGIFVATPDTILKEIQLCLPDLYRGLEKLKKTLGTDSFEVELGNVYEKLEAVSFDFGIMERTKNPVFVVPCECGWSDVGSWASLYELREQEYDGGLNLKEGESLQIDCKNSFISGRSGRLVACLGLDNCLVVDTPDALLVADLDRSQEIRKIVEQLKRTQKEELL